MIKISFLSNKFATLRLKHVNDWYAKVKDLKRGLSKVVVLSGV